MAKKTSRISHGVAVSTLFSAISLLYGSAAYGGFYPGHIDPTGTGTVPGFIGNFVVSIDPGCLSDGLNFTGSSGCGNASVYSANIDLYSLLATDPPVPGTILGTFSLGTSNPQSLPLSTFNIFEVLAAGGQPLEIQTGSMGAVFGTGATYGSNQFWLQFVIPDPAFIYMDSLTNQSNPGIVTFGPSCTDPNDCRVPAAPEPGTLALLFGALGGGWLVRRRKAKLKA